MRIWSLHPRYLDSKGLVALWRETLLAQAVLLNRTKGYAHHPQLIRFRASRSPTGSIAAYLGEVAAEATQRGYRFDTTKIVDSPSADRFQVTIGQMTLERGHLLAKLVTRDPDRFERLRSVAPFLPHPLFDVVPGEVEPWEKAPHSTATPTLYTATKTFREST